jgi:NAD(P)-dependent dehydrogenase (short-subunit alcohol dehydrogenase family)
MKSQREESTMSERGLAGRKALVTGGARGIGAAIPEALSKAGASVMIGDILADLGRETAGRLAKTGTKIGFVELNVTDDAQWEKAVAATIATLGGYDILINNAGIEITSLVVDLRAEDLRRMCDVNIVGTALGMKHAFRAMRSGGGAGTGGAIVNIASVAATIAFPAIAGYIKHGPEVVDACLAAGCHYSDTTGEQDWVLLAQQRWGAEFAKKGLLLAPNIAQMYTTGEIAANICLETPGLDTLDILVLWKGFPTYASTQTIFTILKANWYYLVQNKFVEWDVTANFEVNVPGQHEGAIAVPWGGTAHPVWFKNDPRVSNCRVLGGVMQRDVMLGVVQTQEMVKEKIKPLPPDQQEKALADIAATLQATMPPRENPRINTSIDSVYASGPLGRAHCVIHGNCNYKQTGMLQAYAAFSLLQTAPRKVGFASACQAFGHRGLLGQLRSFGLVMNPILTVHA